MGITGTQAAKRLEKLTGVARDKAVLEMVDNGDVPRYIRKDWWKWVEVRRNGHTLRYLVAPDYFAVGTDDDPLRVPVRPETLQAIAEHYDAIIPSRRMIRDIEAAADTHIAFLDVKGAPHKIPLDKITTWEAVIAANDMANDALEKEGVSPGDGIVIGYKKAVVSAPDQDGSHVYIVGGNCNLPGGKGCAKYHGVPAYDDKIQPPMNGHGVYWVDDSHGGVLVSTHGAKLDGKDVDLVDEVFMSDDPKIRELVNDHGVKFRPEFPNKGPNAVTKYSIGPTGTTVTTTTKKTTGSAGAAGEPMSPKTKGLLALAFAAAVIAIAVAV